ncbi:MAG: hypothetical protein ACHQRJ_23290 [Alphaproteobacteria bacterium]
MEAVKGELLARIERDRDLLIDFFRKFIRCASPNPPGDTQLAAKHIRSFLDARGVHYRVIAPNPIMPNIVASFETGKPGRHFRAGAASFLSPTMVILFNGYRPGLDPGSPAVTEPVACGITKCDCPARPSDPRVP